MDYLSLTFLAVVLLIFVDGLIFGVAASKGIVSILLIIVGLLLASFIGLAIPFVGGTNFMGGIEALVINAVTRYGPAIFAMPVLWIIGFIVGLILV